MHILLTRPLEDSKELIMRFKSLGHKVSHLPVINIKKKDYDEPNFEEFKGEIARLKLVNEGQDETAANNSAQLARASESLVSAEARLNVMLSDLAQISDSLDSLSGSVASLGTMRGDLESIRQALNSGDSTVLGLVGRLEYIEQSMESVNAHRLQINETLFRLQESVESLQRSMSGPAPGL